MTFLAYQWVNAYSSFSCFLIFALIFSPIRKRIFISAYYTPSHREMLVAGFPFLICKIDKFDEELSFNLYIMAIGETLILCFEKPENEPFMQPQKMLLYNFIILRVSF